MESAQAKEALPGPASQLAPSGGGRAPGWLGRKLRPRGLDPGFRVHCSSSSPLGLVATWQDRSVERKLRERTGLHTGLQGRCPRVSRSEGRGQLGPGEREELPVRTPESGPADAPDGAGGRRAQKRRLPGRCPPAPPSHPLPCRRRSPSFPAGCGFSPELTSGVFSCSAGSRRFTALHSLPASCLGSLM